MGLGSGFENRGKNRLKAVNEEKEIIVSNFDYSEISLEDKEELLHLESLVKNKRNELLNKVIELGEVLFNANQKLANYKTGKFIEWYESLGMNKDEVSVALKRYSIYLEYPNKKESVAELPVRTVKALTKDSLRKLHS